MPYSRPHIKQALAAAQEAGKPVQGFASDRETVLQLERWGFLPIDHDEVDKRVQDWYVANGLAVRVSDTPDSPKADTPNDTPERVVPLGSHAAIDAAEAALAAATAALRLARSMAS